MLAVVEGTYSVWRECLRSVPRCDSAAFDMYVTGALLDSYRRTVSEWQAMSYEVVNVDSLTYEVLEVNLNFTIPHVTVCERDGGMLVERKPGEPERVVEAGYTEKIRQMHMVRGHLGWRVEGLSTINEELETEGALCS